MKDRFIIGTRGSKLALWQSEYVQRMLVAAMPGTRVELKIITTKGDDLQKQNVPLPSVGGKGLFTAELEEELKTGDIDLAVHSLKDLPTSIPDGLILSAICEREDFRDILITKDGTKFQDLPHGASIGTSSLRRSSQLLRIRGDINPVTIRGNIDTRIGKLHKDLGYDAVILALAGVRRIGRESEVTQFFTPEEMLPAPGQGALAVECAEFNEDARVAVSSLDNVQARIETTAERTFLQALGAGCNMPVAALGTLDGQRVIFKGRCLSPNGDKIIDVEGTGDASDPAELGLRMAAEALRLGFRELGM